jgi:hypothetical protein
MIAAALRALPVIAVLAGGVSGDGLASNGAAIGQTTPRWSEVKWPFAVDQWGGGRAFQCAAADCGGPVNIYLRPKIGFCNCAKGVYDDAELDRVDDMSLIGPQFAAVDDGQVVTVGWMRGRSRAFAVSGPYQPAAAAAAIAFNDKCDVVVATVTAAADLPRATQQALQFLNSESVLRWARAELGSNGS